MSDFFCMTYANCGNKCTIDLVNDNGYMTNIKLIIRHNKLESYMQ
jgi:hypothetical protein